MLTSKTKRWPGSWKTAGIFVLSNLVGTLAGLILQALSAGLLLSLILGSAMFYVAAWPMLRAIKYEV